jgi:hypothetical protein
MARLHTPDENPTRARARARRNIVLVAWWGFALVLVFWLSTGGPAVALLPLVVIGALVVSNTVQVVRGDVAVAGALAPGRLERATIDEDPVDVAATRAPDDRERGRRRGVLSFAGGRLSFTFESETRSRRGPVTDPLSGTMAFDVRPDQLVMGPRPTLSRPRLKLTIDGSLHVIEFTMPGDLAAGVVGSVVAAAWWDQLRDLGART